MNTQIKNFRHFLFIDLYYRSGRFLFELISIFTFLFLFLGFKEIDTSIFHRRLLLINIILIIILAITFFYSVSFKKKYENFSRFQYFFWSSVQAISICYSFSIWPLSFLIDRNLTLQFYIPLLLVYLIFTIFFLLFYTQFATSFTNIISQKLGIFCVLGFIIGRLLIKNNILFMGFLSGLLGLVFLAASLKILKLWWHISKYGESSINEKIIKSH